MIFVGMVLGPVCGISAVGSDVEVNDPLSPRAVIDIVDGEVVGITEPVTAEWLKGQFSGDVLITTASGEVVDDNISVPSDSVVSVVGETVAVFVLPGDASRDGKINLSDTAAILKKIAKWDIEISYSASDIDKNGKVSLGDVSVLLKYIAGWEVALAEKAVLRVSFDEYVLLSSDPETDRAVTEAVRSVLGKDVTVVSQVTDGMKYITVGTALWNKYDFMDVLRCRALFPENSYIDTYGGDVYLTACGDAGIEECVRFLVSAEEIIVPRGYVGTVGHLTGESQVLYAEAVERILAAEENGDSIYEMTDDIYTALANAEYTEPKNIIYMIGDGMGVGAVTSAEILYGSKLYGGTLSMKYMPVRGSSTTFSAIDQYTDSAAGGTALATGNKTTEGTLSMDPDHTVEYRTLTEIANELGKSTGVVVTCSIVDATPAAFITHVKNREMHSEIARQQITALVDGKVDLIFGGGSHNYAADDVKETLDSAVLSGVTYTNDFETAKEADLPVAGLFSKHAFVGNEGEPAIAEMTETAIEKLSLNENGFFLMVEGSEIDSYAHYNELENEAKEVYEFDCAVAVAMKYAALNPDTVVIVTADHETGGLSVPPDATTDNIGSVSRYFMGRHHWINVPVYAVGYGVGELSGLVDNTHIARFTAGLMGEENFGHGSVIKPFFNIKSDSVVQAFVEINENCTRAENGGISVVIGDVGTEIVLPMEHICGEETEFSDVRTINITYHNTGDTAVNPPGILIFNSGTEYRLRDWCIFIKPGESLTMSYVLPAGLIGEGALLSSDYIRIYGSKAPNVYLDITDISVTCYSAAK